MELHARRSGRSDCPAAIHSDAKITPADWRLAPFILKSRLNII